MDHTTEVFSTANEHYEILQRESAPASLREFNAELLLRIGDFRKKNLELAAKENDLRRELASQEKRELERERIVSEKYQDEIASLKRALSEALMTKEQTNEEWTRRLSALTDEKWDLELALENSKKTEFDLKETIAHLEDRLNKTAKLNEAAQTKETQMIAAFEALRNEYTNVDHCYRGANETVAQQRAEIHALTARYESAIQQLQERLKVEHRQQSEAIVRENTELRSMLSVRDTKLEAERASLQTLKERLAYLDQHLHQPGERVKRDKAELASILTSVKTEVEFALEHPFKEYLEIAEQEIAFLEKQLQAPSTNSIHRAKLEHRMREACAHRDAIKGMLENSESELRSHFDKIAEISTSVFA
jgi:chromosome segregation ATPase